MTKEEFLGQINAEITFGGAIPYQVPLVESERIYEQSLNWFYNNYKDAVETQHYVIERHWFQDPVFQKTRSILLPDCVFSVYDCREITGGSRIGIKDSDFSFNKMIAAETFLSPFGSDDLVMRTAQYAYWDLTKAYILEVVRFDYNRNTNRLKILGRTPSKNLFLETYVKIEESKLYKDYFFQRWVSAQHKISLGNMLSFFSVNLPGGITINADTLKSDGQEEIEKIKEEIDAQNPADWFFIYH